MSETLISSESVAAILNKKRGKTYTRGRISEVPYVDFVIVVINGN